MRELGRFIVPTKSSAPATPTTGELYYDTTTGLAYVYDGTTWDALAGGGSSTKTFRTTHTFAVKGTIAGAADTTPSFFVSKATGQTVNIVKSRSKIASGTNVTFKIQRNGADMTGYGTTAAPLTASPAGDDSLTVVTLADNDEIDLVIVGASGSPTDLTVTVVLEHTV